jgi:hypothetical protein
VTRVPSSRTDPPITSPPWRAWAGLFGGFAGWALHHQIGSSSNFARCSTANGWLVIAVGLVACLIIVASGALSWTAWRGGGGAGDSSHEAAGRFVPAVSLMAAALFLLTVLVQMTAALIVPACWR